ncbi:MAG: hypothetical protein CMF37_15195 [Leeuwenhoekiella sp.]|nr:hypothetical protein [Leeuwenhoekiella sp.]MBQ50236.1 hypothetical protein [Leeuwenhoekiella sp.]MBQ50433.1 hypothetical protein [Leeuwenhoekiella sp.]|tara:strand:- start:5221 stop:6108 length:888 start_codon:yes stop_codon:yes gene_type:complete
MKLTALFSSLLPSTSKETLLGDINLIRESINLHTLPVYKTAADLTRKAPLKGEIAEEFERKAKRNLELYKDNAIQTVHTSLTRAVANLSVVEELIRKNIEQDSLMRDAMTYTQASLIQYVQVARFCSSYARRLLLVMTEEASEVLSDDYSKSSNREMEYVKQYMDGFIRGINAIGGKKQDTVEAFEKIPDILLNPETVDVTKQTVGINRMDPFKFNLIPYRWNPIYHLRMAIANYQVQNAKLAQEELESLELRLLHLKQRRDGKENASIEQQINHTQGRIDKLRYKLHRDEEKAA